MIIKKLQAYDCAEGYTISEYGDVYRNGKKLSRHIDHNGYYQIRLYNKNKKRLSVLVHRLVAFTFLDTPETLYQGGTDKKGYTVDHIDGDKINNHYTNLKWVSFYDNIKKNTNFEYMDDEKTRLIIQDLLDLYSVKEIVEKYNVSKTLVERIRQKQRYKHLLENVRFPTTRVHRDRTEMLTIIFYTLKYLSINSVRLSNLLKEHLNIKCSANMIYNIRNNSTCKEYIKFVKNNNWKPSETIEMDKLVTE